MGQCPCELKRWISSMDFVGGNFILFFSVVVVKSKTYKESIFVNFMFKSP